MKSKSIKKLQIRRIYIQIQIHVHLYQTAEVGPVRNTGVDSAKILSFSSGPGVKNLGKTGP